MKQTRLFCTVRPLCAGLALVLLAGCVAIEPADRAVATPVDWNATATESGVWPTRDWWRGFASTELDTLIGTAENNNLDLAAAAARVLQAEAQARSAGAALLPTVDLSVGASRAGSFGGEGGSDSFSAGLGASYELDFWGRNRAGLEAARAALRGSRYNRDTVALTVTAGVANTYLQVLSLRDRLAIARLNLANAERVLGIVDSRVRNGAVSRLDLAQQRATVASLRASIPPLEQQERDARSALAILLGRAPQGFDVQAITLAGLQAPPVIAGLPAGLLTRRPDIAAAEANLAAADADLAAARAALLPSVQLTGSSGVRSDALRDLFDGDPFYNIGASLVQTVFDGGRLRAQRDSAAARQLELLQNYRAAVLAGFADVESALGSTASLAEQTRAQEDVLSQAQLAFQLAETRYRAGEVDLLTVLDAQRTLYSAQDQLRQLRLAQLQAVVGVYRALGGGWELAAAD